MQANLEQNVADAVDSLSHLSVGLDVNVGFTSVTDFEYTKECIVFDLLSIDLVHGWLYDPQDAETARVIGSLSYNHLVEKLVQVQTAQAPPPLPSEPPDPTGNVGAAGRQLEQLELVSAEINADGPETVECAAAEEASVQEEAEEASVQQEECAGAQETHVPEVTAETSVEEQAEEPGGHQEQAAETSVQHQTTGGSVQDDELGNMEASTQQPESESGQAALGDILHISREQFLQLTPDDQKTVVEQLRRHKQAQADQGAPAEAEEEAVVVEELSQLHRTHSELVADGMVLEGFLETSSSQLTYYGISELHRFVKEGKSCVLFRNNHFSVLHKHDGRLFVLVTDEGYTYQPNIVYEELVEVEGDSDFFTADFLRYTPGGPPPEPVDTAADEEMAKKLQQQYEEEHRRIDQAQQQRAQRAQQEAQMAEERRRQAQARAEAVRKEKEKKKHKKKDSCVVC
eukprot:TRINITY_DN16070_c0_g1_i2.p1 TRINITY_DN16070_c0_g1~~TRINITY_DN16070_c0_g1_i2.p1  ORF type:complete len:458 (-),score=126.98 TRINITY_DN16070_c0_g1_i2:216-1589(-)